MNFQQFHPPRRAAAARRVPGSARSGVSLMEVLISIFVVSIGLLGIAALIPVANYALVETSKADRTAACGQAAIRDIRVRRLADPVIWPLSNDDLLNNGNTYAIDPLGTGGDFGAVPRVDYSNMPADVRERIFYWHDDLLFDMREGTSERPRGFPAHGNAPISERSYSWFLTVTPAPRRLNISVVVCYQRDLSAANQTKDLDQDPFTAASSSGTIISGIQVTDARDLEPGQWILLTGKGEYGTTVGQWYRITAGADAYFAVEGPNWPSLGGEGKLPTQMAVVPGVLGVYTTSVELNRSPEWWPQ